MPENEPEIAPESETPIPRSPWTPRALLLVGILCSIPGLIFSTALFLIARDAVWLGVFGLVCLTGAALCFARARASYRRGYVLPLSYREQIAAACATTLFLSLVALSAVQSRHWGLLMVALLNPMLLTTWRGVFQKRPRSRVVRPAGSGSLAVAEKPAAGHWWTHYDTRQQNDEDRTKDRLTNGKR